MPNRHTTYCCLAAFLFAWPLVCLPQQSFIISKKILSIEEGMASREVNCATQDEHGFMWFGTRNGLNRYDGENFITFTKQQGGLRQNKIIQLATDYHNHLFIMYGKAGVQHTCSGEIDVLDLITRQVSSISKAFPDMPFKEEDVFWISNDGSKALCFIVAHPFSYWRYENNRFTKKLNLNAWAEPPPQNRDFAGWGYHYLFQQQRAVLRDGKHVYFISPDTSFTLAPQFTGDDNYGVLGITPTGEFLVNGWNNIGITSFNKVLPDGKFVPNISLPALEKLKYKEASVMFCQNSAAVVIKTSSPASLMLSDLNRLFTILDEAEMKKLRNLELDQVFTDREGGYWIITSHGVIYTKLQKNRFTHYFSHSDTKNRELNNQVRGIYSDGSGWVYANLWNNLYIRNPSGADEVNAAPEILYALIPYRGTVYTAGHFPFRYNKVSKSLNPLKGNDEKGEIWSMLSLNDSIILTGCGRDIAWYNTNTGKSYRCLRFTSANIPEPKLVYRFFKDINIIWAAAQNGLYSLNAEGNIITDYFGDVARGKHKLPFRSLNDAFKDSDGIFWLATDGDGLYRWDMEKNEFRQFSIPSGLPSDILYRIEEDAYGYLWISSDNGLIHFNKKSQTSQVYTVKEGLSHNEFNRISSFKDKNGIMYFGGLNGVNTFNPEDFRKDEEEPGTPLQITYFSKFSSEENKLVEQTTSLTQEKKIILHPGDRFLDIAFRLLDFDRAAHLYAYKIEGLDKQWTFIKEGSMRISGLPYGNYLLHIRAQDASGRWSAGELKIPVEVKKPFYLTLWFLGIALLVSIGVITSILKLRVYNLQKNNLMLEVKVEERTEELKQSLEQKEVLFQEVHHRVKNNLQVIASLLELEKGKTKNEETQMALIETLNRVFSISFIHQNLYRTGDLKGVEMSTFVNELTGHIRNIFFNPELTVHVKNSISDVELDIDTAVPCGLIINELMTNSYKYAFAGKSSGTIQLHLSLLENGNYFFSYEDDGCGIPKEFNIKSAQTLGMRLIYQLSRQIAGTFTFSGENGVKFEIEFKGSEARSKMI